MITFELGRVTGWKLATKCDMGRDYKSLKIGDVDKEFFEVIETK